MVFIIVIVAIVHDGLDNSIYNIIIIIMFAPLSILRLRLSATTRILCCELEREGLPEVATEHD